MEDLVVHTAFHSDLSDIAHIQAFTTPAAPEMIDTEPMTESQETVPKKLVVAQVVSHTDVRRRTPFNAVPITDCKQTLVLGLLTPITHTSRKEQ